MVATTRQAAVGVLIVVAGAACRAPRSVPPERGVTLFVAPDGSDRASGAADHPFASVARARDEIRALRARTGLPDGGVTVEIAAGRYELSAPLVLTQEDSGTATAPITYRGHGTQLSGGRTVPALAPMRDDDALAVRVPAEARSHVETADLGSIGVTSFGEPSGGGIEVFAAGQRLTLARWPDRDDMRIEAVADGQLVYAGERPRRWIGEPAPWVHGYWYWDWADERQPIAAIDAERHTIRPGGSPHEYGYRAGQWFHAYNVLSELDQPGEWYVDRARGRLYVWRPSETAVVSVSLLTHALELSEVHHVRFVDLEITETRGDAVVVANAEHVELDGCRIHNAGGWGARFSGGHDSGVRASEIAAVGEGGISLTAGDRATLARGDLYVIDTSIHDYAAWKRAKVAGVALAGVGQQVVHDRIADAPTTGIAFEGNDHRIELNDIERVCTDSNDAGAIYAGRDWTMRGNVIRGNSLHDITGRGGRGAKAVYLDDMLSGTLVAGNMFERVTYAVFIGGGRDTQVIDNVFRDSTVAIHVDARARTWAANNVGILRQRMAAMPLASRPWRARYGDLAASLADEPTAPKGTHIARNTAWRTTWLEIEDGADRYVELGPNAVDVAARPADPPGERPGPRVSALRDGARR